MQIIGLTGGFGTGKSFAASVFRSLGAKVIDADKIAHGILKKGSFVYRKVVASFGKDILDRRGDIDRKALAELVFANRRRLEGLNKITHPEVIRSIKDRIKSGKKDDIFIIDAPLLIEANLGSITDKIIVVKASRKNQILRCIKKIGISKTEVVKRIKSQMPLKEKEKMADFVIDNDGKKSSTRKQVKEIWRKIWR